MEFIYLIAIIIWGVLSNRSSTKRPPSKVTKPSTPKQQNNLWTYDFASDTSTSDPEWDHLRQIVLKRDDHQCVLCSFNKNLTVDHIIPRHLGGSDLIDNLQTLCKSCHENKHGREIFTPNRIFTPRLSNAHISKKIQTINTAILTKSTIQIHYIDDRGNSTYRSIDPISLFEEHGHAYLRAYCKLRNDGRTFRVSRITITS